jgi:hypothetical protein
MKAERKNITHPADWWYAFEEQAEKEGMTLSAWIGECCLANLPKEKQKKLSQRQAGGRPRSDS